MSEPSVGWEGGARHSCPQHLQVGNQVPTYLLIHTSCSAVHIHDMHLDSRILNTLASADIIWALFPSFLYFTPLTLQALKPESALGPRIHLRAVIPDQLGLTFNTLALTTSSSLVPQPDTRHSCL